MEMISRGGPPISLLYVEDHQVTREAICEVIAKRFPSLTVYTAEDGEIALNLFKKHGADIVLTDINMPVMDGLQMAREIRALRPATIIIAATAFSDTRYLLEAINIGISRYVMKPIELKMLFEILGDCIARVDMERQVEGQNDFIRKLSRAVEQSPSMLVITDVQGAVEYVNPKFTGVTGYAPEDVIGRHLRLILTDASAPDGFDEIWGTISGGSDWRGELMNTKKDGEPCCLEVHISPLAGENGEVANFVVAMEDISQRKRTEDTLREKEFFIQESQRAAFIGSYKLDFIKGAWESSEVLDQIFGIDQGYTRNLAGWLAMVHPDDSLDADRYLREEVIAKGTPLDREYRIVRRSDRAIRWVNCRGKVVLDADQRLRAMIGTIQDITERKCADEELKLKSFTIDNLAEEIIWTKPDYSIWDVNEVACKKLGYTREELLSLSITDLDPRFPAGDPARHWEKLRAAGSLLFESVHRAKDGHLYPVEIISNHILHNGHEYSCSIVRDITERKRLQKALQESEKQFRTLCEFSPIGIFRTDGDGNNIYCNPRWEEITGLTATRALGKGWLAGIHPEDSERLAKIWEEAVASGELFSIEHRQLTPEGKVIWVRALASSIKGADGSTVGYVGTLEDITELQRSRQELLKTQKLESLGLLAGGIAHDFNNILTGILGNIALARFQVDEPEQMAKRLEDAEKATARAKGLTHQLLTFARGGEPVKKAIRIDGLLKEAAEFVLHGSNVRCEFALSSDLWAIEADEGQLFQVLQNLILNAVQAMPDGGTISICARNVSSQLKGMKFVTISVSDTGVGIPEHHLQKIFDPYFTTKQKGSGLGLATCYSIIRKHGGKIRASSTIGSGSSFKISLPATKIALENEPVPDSEVYRGSGFVLVMDDEESVRDISKTIMESFGYTVECAKNGADAIELFRQRKEAGSSFSAVILDLTIPGGIGGKEVIKKLLEMDPEVKAIVSSGYSDDPVMANFREYGFSAVLCKPYRPQEMNQVLQRVSGL